MEALKSLVQPLVGNVAGNSVVDGMKLVVLGGTVETARRMSSSAWLVVSTRHCTRLLLIYSPSKGPHSSTVSQRSAELDVMCSLTCTATSIFPHGTLLRRGLSIRVVNAVAVPSARVAALSRIRDDDKFVIARVLWLPRVGQRIH
jgi:hypothetical protein